MKEKVYIDATILSYYHDERESLRAWIDATREWWDVERQHYDCWLSEAVIAELAGGTYPNRDKILKTAAELPVLANTPEVFPIASYYIENFLMPRTLTGDAIHLAYASYLGFQYLLTWNCNHLANANKRKHIRILNGRLGLPVPDITTPLELFKEIS